MMQQGTPYTSNHCQPKNKGGGRYSNWRVRYLGKIFNKIIGPIKNQKYITNYFINKSIYIDSNNNK